MANQLDERRVRELLTAYDEASNAYTLACEQPGGETSSDRYRYSDELEDLAHRFAGLLARTIGFEFTDPEGDE